MSLDFNPGNSGRELPLGRLEITRFLTITDWLKPPVRLGSNFLSTFNRND
jgi:hypothetical protein